MNKNAVRQIQYTLLLLVALAIFLSTTTFNKPAPEQDPTIQEIEELAREYQADTLHV